MVGVGAMLDSEKVAEIRRLLADAEWSHRRIAVTLGVGRSTVGRIARGEYAPIRAERKPLSPFDDPADDDGPFSPPHGTPRRCPRCGAKVQQPCLACRVRLWAVIERMKDEG